MNRLLLIKWNFIIINISIYIDICNFLKKDLFVYLQDRTTERERDWGKKRKGGRETERSSILYFWLLETGFDPELIHVCYWMNHLNKLEFCRKLFQQEEGSWILDFLVFCLASKKPKGN